MNIASLRNYSLAYMLAPNTLFLLGWFRLYYAIPVLLGLGYLFYSQVKRSRPVDGYQLSTKNLLWLLLAAGFWTFCTGTGGLSFQVADHIFHNAKYYDLFKNPWPTYFPKQGQFARYYYGFFIVPAFISKLLGYLSVSALVIWAVAGYWLVLQWLYLLLRKRGWLIFVFLFVGGIGHLIKVLYYQINTNQEFHIAAFYTEIWALFDQSIWVSSQIIPILLVTSMLVYDAFIRDHVEESFFPITLTFFWAIFPGIILVLLFGIILVKKYLGNWKSFFTKATAFPLLLAALTFLPVFLFLSASDSTTLHGFIWEFEVLEEILMEYFVGVIVELILFYLISRELRDVDKLVPYWFVLAAFMLLFIMSLYRIGYMNDWFIRGYNPMAFIILLFIVRSLYQLYEHKQWKRTIYFNTLIVILGITAFIPIKHVLRSLQNNVLVSALSPGKFPFKPLPFDSYPNTYEAILAKSFSGEPEAIQYLGSRKSIYSLYLAPKATGLENQAR